MDKFNHRPHLQGLRGLAALAVIAFHTGILPHGYLGVDFFFVLSGFLMTSLLAGELLAGGTIDYAHFYARRLKRLLPPSLLVLGASALATRTLSPSRWLQHSGDWLAAVLFAENWVALARQQDYWARQHGASPVLHYWSLSVEEQFYFAWPPLLAWFFFLARSRLPPLLAITLALVLLGGAWTAAQPPPVAHFSTFARVYQLLAGAALAFWRTAGRSLPPAWTAWPAAAALALLVLGNGSRSPAQYGLLATAASTALLAALEAEGGLRRALAAGLLVHLGDLSYALYLWHEPAALLPLPAPGILRFVLLTLISYVLSLATWRWLEQPLRALEVRGRAAQIQQVALAAIAVFAVLFYALGEPVPVTDMPDMNEVIEIVAVDGAAGCVADPRAVTYVLGGDSYLGEWTPCLDSLLNSSNITFSKVMSGSADWLPFDRVYEIGDQDRPCHLHRRIDKLVKEKRPALTLLFSHTIWWHPHSYQHWQKVPGREQPQPGYRYDPPAFLAMLEAVVRDYMPTITPYTMPVIVLPHKHPVEPPWCPQGQVCPSQEAIFDGLVAESIPLLRALGRELGFRVVEQDFICPTGSCLPREPFGYAWNDKFHIGRAGAVGWCSALQDAFRREGLELTSGRITAGSQLLAQAVVSPSQPAQSNPQQPGPNQPANTPDKLAIQPASQPTQQAKPPATKQPSKPTASSASDKAVNNKGKSKAKAEGKPAGKKDKSRRSFLITQNT